MRFFSLLAAVAGLTSLASAASILRREAEGFDTCELAEIPCEYFTDPVTPTVTERSFDDLTNAQRLALGLPLKAPLKRTATQNRRTDPSTVPPSTFRGRIRVDKADGSSTVGYLSRNSFSRAQYRYQGIDDAATVSFTLPSGATQGSQLEIKTENIDSGFDLLGFVQGRDNTDADLRSGSYQYVYAAGTKSTAPGATPQSVDNSYTTATGTARASESAVWNIDTTTGAIVPIWINADGNPAQNVQLWQQSTAIYGGSDPGAFVSRYPSPIFGIKFVFEPL